MKFGVCLSNYGLLTGPEVIRRTALEAERLNFESVFVTDHILLPKSSGTPYTSILETTTTLGFLAAITKRVRIGISSLVMAMRNPAIIAKQLATIDVLSGGRVVLATGAGWNPQEFANLGVDFHTRGRVLDESIRLIRSLWSGKTEFRSEVLPHRIKSAVLDPKPPQRKLPIWIGGVSEVAMKRAIALGDAWHPDSGPINQFHLMIERFRSLPGRKIPVIPRIGLDTTAKETWYTGAKGDRQSKLCGDMEKNKEILETFRRNGVHYAVLEIDYDGKTSLANQIRNLRLFAKEFVDS